MTKPHAIGPRFRAVARLALGLSLSGALAGIGGESDAPSEPPPVDPAVATYEAHVQPLLQQYCYRCHGKRKRGGLDLREFPDSTSVQQSREVFEAVLANLREQLMPPEDSEQPTPAERDLMTGWIEGNLFTADCDNPDPGRVTIRRLNRTEYNNTVRDLLGVDLRPADEFPEDDTGYGFDNIGDVLTVPPVLFERYLAAAEKVTDAAILEEPEGATDEDRLVTARRILAKFTERAFRRPVEAGELDRLLALYSEVAADGAEFDESVKVAMQAVLISPHFLFRGETRAVPQRSGTVQPIDEFALATRLSYFLWSTTPDEELLGLAKRGLLRLNLEDQVLRLLDDPRASALVENFAGQWLLLRKLDTMAPDPAEYPEFDEELRAAMRRETELFCERIMREDRSVLEFVDSDWTYANGRLAAHYGLGNVRGDAFRLVSLRGTPRGGLLAQASILTLTSNPTRTSPVKRGKWVLDNLLGMPPPPPPPNVPELEETPAAELSGTLRERMVQHREDPLCASCHARMDPIGFGFENFDGVGAWRERDGQFAIDAGGALATGETFQGPSGLKQILRSAKREKFVHCLASKMLTYALGRGLEYYDECALDEIGATLQGADYRFSALILAIVKSVPFQMQRNDP